MTPGELRTRITELTRQGMSARQIADMLDVTTRTVFRARRASGCSRPVPLRLTDNELRRAKELLADGANYCACALGRAMAQLERNRT